MLGRIFRVGIFGESHGKGVGALIEGMPPGIPVTEEDINRELARRRPGGRLASPRKEEDKVTILSGVFQGYTTGAPIALFIHNKDVDSSFYERIKHTPRPGHADYVAFIKYYGYNDYRGGGIFSGRRTAALVAAGALAKKLLETRGIRVYSYVVNIGGVSAKVEPRDSEEFRRMIDESPLKCPDPEASKLMEKVVVDNRASGDSVGSIVETVAFNVPIGLGEPPLDPLDADIAKAVLSLPAAKGIEFGAGFKLAEMKGSESNDELGIVDGEIRYLSNNAGGITGGISNGMPIVFRVVFKPPSTIRKEQRTVDITQMKPVTIKGGGRHDPVIGPRAAPVVEATTSIVLADHLLRWLSWKGLGLKRRERG